MISHKAKANLHLFSKLREEARTCPILITGANGFKGTWMTLLLQELGIPCTGIGLPTKPESVWAKLPENERVEFEEIDIRVFDKLNRFIQNLQPRIVVHLAAQPLVIDGYLRPRETFETNVQGTVNLIDSCLENSVKVIQVITTDKVYQIGEDSKKSYHENDPLGGIDPYSTSKVAVEEIVKGYRSTRAAQEANIFSVRAGNVVGGGDRAENRLLPDIVENLKYGTPVVLRNPESVRPWQHVLDPVLGYLLAIENVLAGKEIKRMNFGPNPELALTVREVLEIAVNRWNGHSGSQQYNHKSTAYYESNFLQLSSDYAKSELGWSTVWSQQEAIQATIDWESKVYRENVTEKDACLHDIKKLISAWEMN